MDRSHRSRGRGLNTEGLIAGLLARCTFPEPNEVDGDGDGVGLIAGVSGGADSLALLVLARAADLPVVAVHVDHGLRPGSDTEAAVVEAAARRFGAGFRSETVAVESGPDLEQRARDARRSVLGVEAMTGHTADDQAETLLLNLLRGAGPAGLGAMVAGPRHPILGLRRHETESLCAAVGLDPVIDPSNRDPRFRRNRVRHELLPLLADIGQRDPVPLLNRTAELARAMQGDLDGLAAQLDPTDSRALASAPPQVARAALRGWLAEADDRGHPPSSAEIERVMAVVRHEVVACELAGGRRVARRDGILRLD